MVPDNKVYPGGYKIVGYVLGVDIGGTKMEAALFKWQLERSREECLVARVGGHAIYLSECGRNRTSSSG